MPDTGHLQHRYPENYILSPNEKTTLNKDGLHKWQASCINELFATANIIYKKS